MDHHVTIPMFSDLWWRGIIISAVGIILALFIARKLPTHTELKLRYIVAASIVLREIVWHYHLIQIGHWEWGASLPLHLCGISRLVSIWLLLRPHQLVFEYLALLGMTGAIMAFFTPELTHGMDDILLFDFYYAHAVIIFTSFYAFYIMNLRMNKWSWLHIFILGHVILTSVGLINFLVGGNYIYLCQRPLADNPLVQGEWPYYLFSFQLGALVFILLFWILFQVLGQFVPPKTQTKIIA